MLSHAQEADILNIRGLPPMTPTTKPSLLIDLTVLIILIAGSKAATTYM